MNLTELFSKIGISQSFMQDFFLLIVFVLMTVAFAFIVGRHRLVQMLISIYISLAVTEAVPKGYLDEYLYKLIFFLALLILLTMFMRRISGVYISSANFMWRIFAVSFLNATLVLSIIFSIIPKKEALGYISKNAYKYLVSPEFHLLWLILPLVCVYLIRKRLN